jgi:hypothetical protein
VWFGKEDIKFATADDEQRIVAGPLLIPEKKIIRVDGKGETYFVYFTAETIEKIAQRYMLRNYNSKATLEHSKPIEDVTLVESWVSKSRTADKASTYGFNLPAGTWYGLMKINNDDIWNNYVKTGVVNAFSIEGSFEHKQVSMTIQDDIFISELEEQEGIEMLGMIKRILKKDNRYKSKEKVEMESYSDYPDSVSNNAKKGIELNDKLGNKCATPVGKIRAQQLAQKKPLSVETIKRMYSYLSRAEAYYDENDMEACGTISFYLWGGLAGKSWSESKLKELGEIDAGFVELETAVGIASSYPGQFQPSGSVKMQEGCPEATQNIELNLKNRQTAIDTANYGPLNPNEPNEDYWKAKADMFKGDVESAKKALCGNCSFFLQTKEILSCIAEGIGGTQKDEWDTIEAGNLGYCEAFDFKCAANRTCAAWVGGGPITMAEVGPRGGIKESDKAPKSDTPNPNPKGEGSAKGDASSTRGAKVTAEQEKTLEGKVKDFNERDSNTKNGNATLGALKSVFQRGLGAYNTSRSPVVRSAEQWAYARVNAFLYLLKNGRPENPKYDTDYDLLPKGHPKSK